jgi:flavin reductase (DIM6/NTAB) family NADH-FMN oxidoreductase RutF
MNDTTKPTRQVLKRILFGSADVHQYCPIGLLDPQSEVSVWLEGFGPPHDVTESNVVVSTQPLTLGIGFGSDPGLTAVARARLGLKFRERQGENRLLGEMRLRLIETIPLTGGQLLLFQPHRCRNYCVARPWLWSRYLYFAYKQWRPRRRPRAPEHRIPASDLHCLFVFYICPRPVVLVSVADADRVNIVPMDLIGPVRCGGFSLALRSTSTAAPLLESSRRVALSSVPSQQAALAYHLGGNHKTPGIDLANLPFPTVQSATFGLPVPQFAPRVREMQIDSVRSVGNYKLFLATPVKDCVLTDGLQFFLVHGFYKRLVSSRKLHIAAPGA